MAYETAAGGDAVENTMYHEEEFDSECFASLSDEEFQKNLKHEKGHRCCLLQFARLEHIYNLYIYI